MFETEPAVPARARDVALDAIPWQTPDVDGTRFAVLDGRPGDHGPFSYAFFIPGGVWDRPHYHASDARIVVVSGQLRLGYGTRLRPARARTYDVGGFVLVPALAPHFDGAEVDTVLVGMAAGPWATTYLAEQQANR